MTDILDLNGWKAISKRDEGNECFIEAEYTVAPTCCLKCGVIGKLYKHGPKSTRFLNQPKMNSSRFWFFSLIST